MSEDSKIGSEISLGEAIGRLKRDFGGISEKVIARVLEGNGWDFGLAIEELGIMVAAGGMEGLVLGRAMGGVEDGVKGIQRTFYNGLDFGEFFDRCGGNGGGGCENVNNLRGEEPGFKKFMNGYQYGIDYRESNNYHFINNQDLFNLKCVGCDDYLLDDVLCEILGVDVGVKDEGGLGSESEGSPELGRFEPQSPTLWARRQTIKISEFFHFEDEYLEGEE
jgi:hypothetical protein